MRELRPDRDRSADSNLATHNAGVLQRKCSCGADGGDCEECKSKPSLSRRTQTSDVVGSAVPSIVHDVLRSPGQSLDSETRNFMESRFGHDFGKLRVHADTHAVPAEAVRTLGHILLNPATHSMPEDNLRHVTNSATSNNLTAYPCATIFANA